MGRSADAPLPALRYPTRRVPLVELSTRSGGAKRAFDVVVAGVGLLCSWPLWMLISSAIKLEDRGPVFYRQARIGQGGRVFHVWKFRSMVPDAERTTGAVLAAENDSRVTRVGRFLRATALDELPQLWNILRGDMSFVGPRPERPELVSEFRRTVEGYDSRFVVVPGLTGLAQVYGRYDSSAREKLRYDRLYIRCGTMRLDIRLIALSSWVTVRGKWEHRGPKF